ncbi:hypothetical protein DEU56DRAFT_887955 [Suillus clintonianus]|uniref:uncharacterized protein n=1 Tax=Suillus clintonianus TaxID=1904413 RepID=UPI001B87771B|nr:uncharacterized protein DEU56DRAFT_887955 [Suillus clintonianus]KAG2135430.1 hypothetical protein DEU56DRAFT_887955 [Suillus clintonianus]
MKFISLTSFIVSVAVMTGVATAYNPIGQSCDTPDVSDCGQDASLNDGNPFVYECSPTAYEYVYVVGCSCPTCCITTQFGEAYCI